MKRQVEGSQAVAHAVGLCRPDVISCYPITPQTHIVERLSAMVKSGELGHCQYMNVESEFASLSALIGASAAGARTYTATSSQGLLFMAEAVFNAGGLGLPIVMTIGNRAIGAPINIWNDHSDSMAMRDAGWIQLHAENNQEALDLHIQAFRIAEELSCPIMVCMDGFVLTHAYDPVDLPSQDQVDVFLPPFQPVQLLDPDDPVTIGAMVGPPSYTEVRYLGHQKLLDALEVIPATATAFKAGFGRDSGGLVKGYRMEDAEFAFVALGSINGSIKDAVDALRDKGIAAGALKVVCYRPFPEVAVRQALGFVKHITVIDRSLAPGSGGVLAADVRTALRGLDATTHSAIAGLGGRAVTVDSLIRLMERVQFGELAPIHFLDLNKDVVDQELERQQASRRSGPTAENILKARKGGLWTSTSR